MTEIQNVNECIHSFIWNYPAKHKFVGKKRLEVVVAPGVGEFNQGSRGTQIMDSLGMKNGVFGQKHGERRDAARKWKADR